MEKVRPWCGQPSDRGRLKNRTRGRVSVLRWRRCNRLCTSGFMMTSCFSGVARIWRWGHRGSGERKSPSGVQRQSPWWVVRGGIASRKLIAVIKDIWLPNHAQFCVFSLTAQPGIFLRTQFFLRGRAPAPPCLRQCPSVSL